MNQVLLKTETTLTRTHSHSFLTQGHFNLQNPEML